jgi:hypothetical protein
MTHKLGIPALLEREVLMEAGRICAIPTCKQSPVEIGNIDTCGDVKSDSFDNLIRVCPTCHAPYDNHKIYKRSMKFY